MLAILQNCMTYQYVFGKQLCKNIIPLYFALPEIAGGAPRCDVPAVQLSCRIPANDVRLNRIHCVI
jgi:hypothetical protein